MVIYRYYLSKNASLYIFHRPAVVKGFLEKLLVSATVAEITDRCSTQVIDIVRATVSYFNVCGPPTTV